MNPFHGWENFYIIVGSAGVALIGLQFIVLTLIASIKLAPRPEAGAAYATPTIIHFGLVLLMSAAATIPWEDSIAMSVIWGVVGSSGFLYALTTIRRMKLQTNYHAVSEDWIFHCFFPMGAYAMLIASSCIIFCCPRQALFISATSLLVLLVVGIHNTWDAVTYHVFVQKKDSGQTENTSQSIANFPTFDDQGK